jgi:hypothetical protein
VIPLLLVLFAMPLGALIAGVVVGVMHRGEALDDGALLRNFLVVLLIALVVMYAGARTDAVRMRLYPQLKVQAQIETHPLYVTVLREAPDDAARLRAALVAELATGASIDTALRQTRPLLTRLATERLGFADQATHLVWGQMTVETLLELKARDADACYASLSGHDLDRATLTNGLSAQNTEEFQQAVIQLYESASRGMRREQPADETPADFNATAREFRAIIETLSQRFDPAISAFLDRKTLPESSDGRAGKLCEARIYELQSMLLRPKATAALLVDSVLR